MAASQRTPLTNERLPVVGSPLLDGTAATAAAVPCGRAIAAKEVGQRGPPGLGSRSTRRRRALRRRRRSWRRASALRPSSVVDSSAQNDASDRASPEETVQQTSEWTVQRPECSAPASCSTDVCAGATANVPEEDPQRAGLGRPLEYQRCHVPSAATAFANEGYVYSDVERGGSNPYVLKYRRHSVQVMEHSDPWTADPPTDGPTMRIEVQGFGDVEVPLMIVHCLRGVVSVPPEPGITADEYRFGVLDQVYEITEELAFWDDCRCVPQVVSHLLASECPWFHDGR